MSSARCAHCGREAAQACANCGVDYCDAVCQRSDWLAGHGATCADMRDYAHGRLSARKAAKILREGTANGHPITARQRRFFGWVAGGSKPYAA